MTEDKMDEKGIRLEERMISLRELLVACKKKYNEYRREFFDTFKVALSTYWDNMFGFDIVAFDAYLVTKYGNFTEDEGLSTRDVVVREYGEGAAKLIESLIDIDL